jgi:S1-C subfamily serine protease
MGLSLRRLGAVLLTSSSLATASSASAQTTPATDGGSDAAPARGPKTVPIGFSRLIVRIDGQDELGMGSLDEHVRLIERMRARGFMAVGAENLVFGKDDSQRAQFLVGGTVRELACHNGRGLACRIGVVWQVLDVAHDRVVYSVLSRAAVLHLPYGQKDRMAGMLLDRAMDRLLERDGFQETLVAQPKETAEEAPAFEAATLPRCAPGKPVTAAADDLLSRAVVVKTKDGFGSGLIVSPEGLVLTAAHVVENGKATIHMHDGTEVGALPVRVAPREDVALLRPEKPLSLDRCLPLRMEPATTGTEVYAVGAPTSLALAFSLTRGIVSGYPVVSSHRRLQTDAPVNPGNSGGPIVDAAGGALGVVSFKVGGAKIEGLGFAVPIPEALHALGLSLGNETDPRLLKETVKVAEPTDAPELVSEDPDPVPQIDPEGVRWRAEQARLDQEAAERRAAAEDEKRRTPWYKPALRWGGVSLAAVGGITIVGSWASYQGANLQTHSAFITDRNWNIAGWTFAGVGGAMFVGSFFVKLKPAHSSSLEIGPGGVAWKGSF